MILQETFDMYETALKANGKTYDQVRICGLGDQRMKWHKAQTEKQYFISQGVEEHISLDWNGRRGALKRDLAKVLGEWTAYFDIVTNFGTTEHVEASQYNAFKNIHNFVGVGGVMIHALPLVGHWEGHCNYHYEEDFFTTLAKGNDYECVLSEVRKVAGRRGRKQPLLCAILQKTVDQEFMTEEAFEGMNKIQGL